MKKIVKKGSIIVHCSGLLSSDILNSAKTLDCSIASIHPVKSFAHPETSVETFPGAYCALEGDNTAKTILTTLFTDIGGIVFTVDKTHKYTYHAACVMANNYLVTLHYHAVQSYLAAGITETTANKLATQMMNDALRNLSQFNHEKSLTGPLQRGDVKTIERHIEALGENKLALDVYCQIGLGTLPITGLSLELKKVFEDIFKSELGK